MFLVDIKTLEFHYNKSSSDRDAQTQSERLRWKFRKFRKTKPGQTLKGFLLTFANANEELRHYGRDITTEEVSREWDTNIFSN
ncbi:hypothetical protein GWI33_002874 [Rhynchophorus ferrugineus]|uniref:Uncharacterized protein n=1 Tax=Rhynchophorus ferrugineus TaxID=354439 RepID=A0A834MJD2_RHYFE|nr:hypothetical protein GWI33_002874 [Rhynchophorus ferrugineus]